MEIGSVCFGYRATAPWALLYARPGAAQRELLIERMEQTPVPEHPSLVQWLEPSGRRPFARLYKDLDVFQLWVDGVGWFSIDPVRSRVAVSSGADEARMEARLWGIPTALSFMHRGEFPLHAAAIDVNGGAILLAAPGKAGKTTLTAAFAVAGFRILNEDLTCCRVAGRSAEVLPGPALLRIRRDSYERLPALEGEVVAEESDRLYISLAPASRGTGEPLPLKGIFLLHRSTGAPEIRRVATPEAIRDLMALSFKIPLPEHQTKVFSTMTSLATAVPVWELHRELRYEGLHELVDLLAATGADETR